MIDHLITIQNMTATFQVRPLLWKQNNNCFKGASNTWSQNCLIFASYLFWFYVIKSKNPIFYLQRCISVELWRVKICRKKVQNYSALTSHTHAHPCCCSSEEVLKTCLDNFAVRCLLPIIVQVWIKLILVAISLSLLKVI
jgi:hypothetical protein